MMTRKGAIACTFKAPCIVLWSVTAMQSRPVFTHLATKSSRSVPESGENPVCIWRSILSALLPVFRQEAHLLAVGRLEAGYPKLRGA